MPTLGLSGSVIREGKGSRQISMEQFEAVLIDTLLIVVKLGVPVTILFLIGSMVHWWRRSGRR